MNDMTFLRSIQLSGFLSFPPDAAAITLTPLNVLIGPNGSGKSSLIEAVELLHAAPTAFAAAIRDGGGAQEWLWKGDKANNGPATIEAIVQGASPIPDLRYRLVFATSGLRTEVIDEAIEEPEKRFPNEEDVYFFYRFQKGRPVLNMRDMAGPKVRSLKREDLVPDESVLSQRKGSDVYPEVTWLGQQFERIQTFREWSFGRYATLRRPQSANSATDALVPDSSNLGLLVNALQHTDASTDYNRLLTRFLPRYQRFSIQIQGGAVQFYLHESGLKSPVSATRLSDGTIRFMAILALLLSPTPPPLICIEEPELGLHPDAVSLLAELLVEASTRTQLIVTTHSDTLVSGFTDHADSVLVCEHHGGTELKRLDSGKLQHWLDRYRLGDIWRIGELGGNP